MRSLRIRALGALLGVTIGGTSTLRTAERPLAAPAFKSEYVVTVADTAAHLFHVRTTFSNLSQPRLELALPVWTPGWYTIENYAKNILRFTVTDGRGHPLDAPRSHVQTWSVDTRAHPTVVVDFDYLATAWAVNQAKITSRNAFFTGTQLFLEPLGHRDAAATVRFVAPPGWRIATALRETDDSAVFTAASYDALADAPTLLGQFDEFRFDVDGKPHYFVEQLSQPLTDSAIAAGIAHYSRMIRTARDIFGSLPYDKYVVFLLPGTTETKAYGSLEHANAYVTVAGAVPDVPYANAHEFFHAWNVKRIRPAELWPYDYSRPNETPSLWFSEGVTSYYADLINYRAGFTSEPALLARLAHWMSEAESNEARHFLSPSDASIATWLGYDEPPAFSVSYYLEGEMLGMLLDVSLAHDTRGARGLDDVMRALYKNYYLRGRGVTPDDLIETVSRVAGTDYHPFFRRYVTGTEEPPYDSILGFAGMHVTHADSAFAWLGWQVIPDNGTWRVIYVQPGTPAAMAGVQLNDVIEAVDSIPIANVRFHDPDGLARWLDRGSGATVPVRLLRNGEPRTVMVRAVPQRLQKYSIVIDSAATPEQLVVRRRWLER